MYYIYNLFPYRYYHIIYMVIRNYYKLILSRYYIMSSYQVNPLEILDTTNSTGVGSGGSLTVGGGVAVGRDLYVGGNVTISGTSTSFADNVLVLNNNTLGSTDTGILLKRAAADVTSSNNFSSILYSETSDSFKFGYVTADTRGTLTVNSLVPIEASGVTAGNINFTGNLYQNGVLFTGSSQWGNGGSNSIFYTTGSVGIGNTSPAFTLDVTGTVRASTGITTATLLATTSVSSASIQGTNLSIANLRLSSTNVALGSSSGQIAQGTNSIAIGTLAGYNSQGSSAVAIGHSAGSTLQGIYSVAIGHLAGVDIQGQNAVAIGNNAGQISQGNSAVAIGSGAAQGSVETTLDLETNEPIYTTTSQGENAVAIGVEAGKYSQGTNAIAIGNMAGQGSVVVVEERDENYVLTYNEVIIKSQKQDAVAIGTQAGQIEQGTLSIAIGYGSGQDYQGSNAVAIGNNAGKNSQGNFAVAIGKSAGESSQSSMAVAIGINAGAATQGSSAIAIGQNAGNFLQEINAIAIGNGAGLNWQGSDTVAIGNVAGQTSQGSSAVAIGNLAGKETQGLCSVAIGNNAGNTSQGNSAVAIGDYAGQTSQGTLSIAIGSQAGQETQGVAAVAIGSGAGQTSQGSSAVAIGYQAGATSQGSNSVAIGNLAGQTSQHANSIILNASSTALNSATAGALYVNPVRNATQANLLAYNTTSKEVSYFSLSTGLTTTNLVATNISTNILIVSGGSLNATFNSNTFGPMITTGGNVGISTTSPSAKLDIAGNMKISSNSESYIYDVTGGTYMYMNAVSTSNSSGYVRLGGYSAVSATQALSLQPAGGNTGVGTTAPSYTLDVNGSVRVSDNLSAISNSNTIGPIITTGGNVGIGTIIPSFKLDITGNARVSSGITTNTLLASTNISTGLLQATSIGAIIMTGTNIVGTASTIGTLRVTTLTTTANLAAGLITSGSMQINSILANTGITTSNLLVTTNASIGQLSSANMTTNNLIVNTLVSSGNIQSALMTTGTLLSNLITVNNLVNTNLSTGSINASNMNVINSTVTNSVHTNISASNFVGGVYNGSNITISGTTASVVYTGGSMSLSGNLTIGGTLIYVNTTNDNYVYTNVTAATLRVTSSLASVTNTNTIGNIITTGGNVGIGTTAPSYLLDVNGSMRTRNINLRGVSSGNISISAPAVAGTQVYTLPSAVPTVANYVMSSNSSGTLTWVSPHHIGDMAARQIDNTFLEMNGQIVNQGSYGTLYTSLGHQPEFKFSVSNLDPGIYANQNILNSNNSFGKNNIARNGSQILAVGTGGLVYSSTDDGTSWNLGSCAVFGTTAINLAGYFGGTWNRWIIAANGTNLVADSTDNGRTWLNRGAGNYNRWDYAFNETDSVGIFVGSGGNIWRSTNGTTWAQSTYTAIGTTTNGTATLRCGGFATIDTTDTFVSAGDGGVIVYSTDNAVTWTQVSDITNTLVFNKIKWVGGSINKFILGGNTNILYTSPDGITWTQQTISGSTGNIQDIVTDDTNETIVIGSSGGVTYSTNATTWTFLAFGGGILSVNYDATNSKFLGVSDSRYFYASKSSIGTWTTVNSIRNKVYRGTCDSNSGGKLFAFSDGGGVIEFNTSTNTETVRVAPGYSIIDMVYGNGVYVALAKDADSSIFTSTDGISWTYRKYNTTTTNYGFTGRRIKYLNGNFIILSTSTTIFTSTNGVTWTERAITNTTKNDVIWTGTNYVIACADVGVILYSSNLSTWTTVNVFTSAGLMTATSVAMNDITYLGSGIVLCACSAGWIFRSADHGVTWTGIQPPDVGPYPFVHIVTDNSSNVVAVTREGTIISYSNDSGDTWSTYKAPTTAASAWFTGLVYGNGKFIVYGRNSLMGVSEDNGATWEWTGIGGHYEIIDMAYGDGFFMGAGLLNSTTVFPTPIVVWSSDGKNWTQRAVPHSMVDTTLTPKQRINYLNKTWMIASNVTLRSANVWKATYPYDISTEFQIPTHYLGNGANKMWIKSLDV